MIRQLDGLTRIMGLVPSAERRTVLMDQADMILRSAEESVPDPADQADVRNAYDALLKAAGACATQKAGYNWNQLALRVDLEGRSNRSSKP